MNSLPPKLECINLQLILEIKLKSCNSSVIILIINFQLSVHANATPAVQVRICGITESSVQRKPDD